MQADTYKGSVSANTQFEADSAHLVCVTKKDRKPYTVNSRLLSKVNIQADIHRLLDELGAHSAS